METKPRSLRAATNPQARMQELLRESAKAASDIEEVTKDETTNGDDTTNGDASSTVKEADPMARPVPALLPDQIEVGSTLGLDPDVHTGTSTQAHVRTSTQVHKPTQPKQAAKSNDRKSDDREERYQKILAQLLSDENRTLTIRIPEKGSDYIDRYVARRNSNNPREKYLKQHAFAEAIAAFIVDHPMPPATEEHEELLG